MRNWIAQRPPGSWVRGRGYDDLEMAEGRHPTRWDLDAAAPNHPVWIEHRSGHAAALNSMALALAGIHSETPDPPGAVIERDAETGAPTGVVYEGHSFLRQRLGNLRSPKEFEDGMRAAGQLLSSYGITSVQDAGADNGIERWHTLLALKRDGVLACRIRMFAGASRLGEFTRDGLAFDSGDNGLRLGHAKIVATMTSGRLHPPPHELESLVKEAHRVGFPVAIHCVEEEVIAVAAKVLESCREYTLKDRIEHCAEGTPPLVDAVKRSGASVVTNPGFLYHNGAHYRENVDERLLPHLYPVGALYEAGVGYRLWFGRSGDRPQSLGGNLRRGDPEVLQREAIDHRRVRQTDSGYRRGAADVHHSRGKSRRVVDREGIHIDREPGRHGPGGRQPPGSPARKPSGHTGGDDYCERAICLEQDLGAGLLSHPSPVAFMTGLPSPRPTGPGGRIRECWCQPVPRCP